jgi:hypothetical protein
MFKMISTARTPGSPGKQFFRIRILGVPGDSKFYSYYLGVISKKLGVPGVLAV